ncbi:MAG: hypothetical protein R2838_05670 [Caldilineaceae bacterium]
MRARQPKRHAPRFIAFVRELTPVQLETKYPEGQNVLYLGGLVRHMVQHARSTRSRSGILRLHAPLVQSALYAPSWSPSTRISWAAWPGWTKRRSCPPRSRRAGASVTRWCMCWHGTSTPTISCAPWPQPSADFHAKWDWVEAGASIDTVNVRLLEERADLDMIAIADGLMTYHRRFLRLLDAADEAALTSSGVAWAANGAMSSLFYDVALHEVEHALDIWQWRNARQ